MINPVPCGAVLHAVVMMKMHAINVATTLIHGEGWR